MKPKNSLLKNILTSYTINQKLVYIVFFTCLFSGIVDAYLLKIISNFVILIGSNIENNISNIQLICIKIFFTAILSGSLRIYINWLIPATASSIAAELSNNISTNISKVEFQIINRFSKDELVDTLTTQKTLSSLAIRQTLFIIFNLTTLITIFSMAIFLAPNVMLSSVFILSISYLIIYKSISKTIFGYSRNYSIINTKLLSQISSLIDNLVIYNLFPLKRKFHEDIIYSNNLLKKTDINTAFLSNSPRFAIESIGIILLAIIPLILITGDDIESFSNILKSLGVFAFSAQKLLPAAQGLYSCVTDLKTKENSLSRLVEIYKLTEKAELKIKLKKIIPLDILQIYLKNALIKPSKTSKLKIKADIKINKGDSIAIIGKTGAGKSTFINSLICNYPLYEGELFINQKKLIGRSKLFHNYRASIAYVPQTSRIINGGIIENITFAHNKKLIDNDFFEECCNLASLDSVLQDYLKSKKDLDFGKRLSGGQIQRIAIARALYQKSSVLILDEATSALDRKTQEKILSKISEFYKNKILITVTHRIETLNFFNRIFEIEGGLIKESFL